MHLTTYSFAKKEHYIYIGDGCFGNGLEGRRDNFMRQRIQEILKSDAKYLRDYISTMRVTEC